MNALSSSPIATSVSAPRYAGLRPLPQGGSEGQVGKGCWGGSEGQTQNPSAWTALTISSPSLHSPTPGETATTLFSTIPTSTLCPLAMNSPETLGDATRCNKVGSYVSAASLGPGGGGGGASESLPWVQMYSAVCALLVLPKAMIWEVLEGCPRWLGGRPPSTPFRSPINN